VCSIGTTDPWNAAGLGLDARILPQCGVRPVMVVAAVSAQDASGVRLVAAMQPDAIAAQWAALSTSGIGAVRVGALYGAAAVRTVAAFLAAAGLPVVYDPVLAASAGGRFADDATVDAIRTVLLPVVTVCAPNLAEASELAGVAVRTERDMGSAAEALRAFGCAAVLITGGHLETDPVDVLLDAAGRTRFAAPRIARAMRGTGCVLAAALAAELAKGKDIRSAVETARAFVRAKIAGAVYVGDVATAD
jgi:hydroxymethylpyrimidine kinase/phosphomethylpyrimidine kinase